MSLEQVQLARQSLDRALLALRAGLPDQALVHLRQALAISPDLPEARLAQARAHLNRHEHTQALGALDAHDLYQPDQRDAPQVSLLRAKALLGEGQADLAIKLLTRLCSHMPDDVRPHRLIAEAYLQQGQTDRAVHHLHQVLRLEPSDQTTSRALAALLAEKNPEAALDVLLADDAGSHDPAQRLLAARLYLQAGRQREAEEAFAQLLAAYPSDAGIWLEAGQLADAMGADDLAVHRLTRAILLGATASGGGASGGRASGGALAALALTHMHAGRLAVAGRCWWRAARGRQGNTQAWAGLLVCALAMGRTSLVRRVQHLVESHTSRQERRELLAKLWLHAGAGLALHQAQGGQPQAPAAEGQPLAQLLQQARATLQTHLEQHSRRADMHYHLAVCDWMLGDASGAAAALESALTINPNYATAARLAARLAQMRRSAA